jgi:manganese/zinc/iron transport system ATP- binding protein
MRTDFQDKDALVCRDLVIQREQKIIVNGLSFTIARGTMAAIVGPNGAGKSSLLHAIVGLDVQYTGQIKIYGTTFDRVRSLVAYVPQRQLVDWNFPTTVFDVVMMGRYVHKHLWQKINAHDHVCVRSALERVDLAEYKNRSIGQLSGGQQQRVFIARALAQEAQLYIMDEPFAGVDIKTEQIIVQLLKDECRAGKTALLVHHDVATLRSYFDWALFLQKDVAYSGFIDTLDLQAIINSTYGMCRVD